MDLLSVIRRWHFRQGIPIREIRLLRGDEGETAASIKMRLRLGLSA